MSAAALRISSQALHFSPKYQRRMSSLLAGRTE